MKAQLKKSFINKLRASHYDYEIAAILGFHKSSISNFLSGRIKPSKRFILSVCMNFDLKPTDFLK